MLDNCLVHREMAKKLPARFFELQGFESTAENHFTSSSQVKFNAAADIVVPAQKTIPKMEQGRARLVTGFGSKWSANSVSSVQKAQQESSSPLGSRSQENELAR